MINYQDLINMIEAGINNHKITEFKWDSKKNGFNKKIPLNTNGVYIMLDIDSNNFYKSKKRIVRIGKAFRKRNGLKDRLKEHFKGPNDKSIFRRLVLSCNNNIDVSQYIRDHIVFVLIKTESDQECKNIESCLIGMVAKEYMVNNFNPKKWLGNNCPKVNVQKSKMWNNHHINSKVVLNYDIKKMFIKE